VPAGAYPADISVTVKVINKDSTPAAGVSVFLQNGNYADLGMGTTDDSGTLSFNVSPGSNAVRALVRQSGADYNITSVWYEAATTVIQVMLPDIGEVSGTIKLGDMAAGNPLVVVDDDQIYDSTPYDVAQQNGSTVHTFTANRFSFTASLGDHSVYAVGYSDGMVYMSDRLFINVSSSPGMAPLVLELKPAGTNTSILTSSVYDHIFHTSNNIAGPVNIIGRLSGADGKPLANVTMVVQDYSLAKSGPITTDHAGDFVFRSVNMSTGIVRFEVTVHDNGSDFQTYSQFYQLQNSSWLEVKLLDYPNATTGFIYGIITNSANHSNPVALSGTVYLSNGLSQSVSPDKNNGQFFFNITPGVYELYAEHQEGSRLMVSDRESINVQPSWSALSVNPTLLVVRPESVQIIPLILSVILGLLCLAWGWFAMRKWL